MKGFTLVEILAAVVILGILIMVALPTVGKLVNGTKVKAYDTQLENIKLAAREWGAENLSLMPNEGETLTIYLWNLKSNSFVKEKLINPKTNKEFPNDLPIEITTDDTGFIYEIVTDYTGSSPEYNKDFPTVLLRGQLSETIALNSTYVDKGLIVIDKNGAFLTNYTTKYYQNNVEVANINTENVTTFEVRYTIYYGISSITLKRTVTVSDITPPVLTIPGDTSISTDEFATFNLMTGVSATDDSNGTVNISVIGTISGVEGSYNVTYRAVDGSGNFSEKTRNITVYNLLSLIYNATKGVNKPMLTGGMRPITFKGTVWDGVSDDSTTYDYVLNIDDPNWYNYDQFKWANAVTDDGSYWVWIPRFAYRIETNYHTKNVGVVSVKMLKGTTNEAADGTIVDTVPTYTGSSQNNYIVHPAFNFGGTPVSGFWVAKFEPTAVEGIDDLGADLSTDQTYDNVTTKTPLIKPSKVSWRLLQNYTMFVNSRNMETNTVYGWDGSGTNMDVHAAKNSEWGAITLFTDSQYGKPGNPTYTDAVGLEKKVWKNPNGNHLTGCAGDTVNPSSSTICNNFTTANGIKSASTGTIYGVYDLVGGAWEVVMGTLNQESASTSGFPSITGASENEKYIDLYTGYNAAESIGDATYEMSSSQGVLQYNTWYGGYSLMPSSVYPFFSRTCGDNTSQCSMYGFAWNFGKSSARNTWRPIIMVGNGL